MDQNTQFVITVGTVIGVFLWLKHDVHQLNAKIEKLNDNYTSMRESLGWIRGGMGFTELRPPQAD
ncbi:MAG: hypothetical protein OXT68_14435 [Chloroflexota bacterium]|nr:hypothetical protein [Chloroflexota bacterium]MDE2951947.1 hypothetical protein [Chloroflexota bacterium]